MLATQVPTRGERLNNPGNVVKGTVHWLGISPDFDQPDPRFAHFEAPTFGIRAICKILISYSRLDGCKTLAAMITRWAPQDENDTEAYIADVEAQSGIAADQVVDVTKADDLAAVATAIIHHENGRCIYDGATINRAVQMALT